MLKLNVRIKNVMIIRIIIAEMIYRMMEDDQKAGPMSRFSTS